MNQGIEIKEFTPSPPPLVELQRLVIPYTDNGTLGEARRLPIETLQLYLAYAEHDRSTSDLRQSLRRLVENQPPQPRGNTQQDQELEHSRREWEMAIDETVAAMIEEDRCFNNPLDDEWGEKLEPFDDVLQWFDCPGGPYELEDKQRLEGLA